MPTKHGNDKDKSSNVNVSNGANLPSFVRYRLSDEEIEQAKNAATSMQDVGEIVQQLVDEGYKFSASFDGYGGGVQAFITPITKKGEPDNTNKGWTLSARGPDLIMAVAVLCFKHYTLFNQIWPKDELPGTKGSSIG